MPTTVTVWKLTWEGFFSAKLLGQGKGVHVLVLEGSRDMMVPAKRRGIGHRCAVDRDDFVSLSMPALGRLAAVEDTFVVVVGTAVVTSVGAATILIRRDN
ncbi:hypothetical protein MLD38_014239 [Melastoma candidum]|uniref:Uncharacterized protein n=1 Tax=Melastoma candidum TaxID=119954 RepID=A0ACB9RBR7_9MYRT|nr:hypothetical protein MLD38_014239 [Melastoma candidum]